MLNVEMYYKTFIKEHLLNIAIIFTLWLLFFWRVIFLGAWYFYGDIIIQLLPCKSLLVEGFKKGTLYLWNPYSFSGTAFIGNIQTGAFYPFNIILLIPPIERSLTFFIIIHFFLAGIFMYFYCQTINITKFSSLFCGIVYMFSAILLGQLTVTSLEVIIWTPLILLIIEKIRNEERLIYSIPGAIVISISLLAGNTHYFYLSGLFVFLYSLLYIIPDYTAKNMRKFIYTIAGIFIMYITGLCLSAIHLIPHMELSLQSFRSKGLSDFFYRVSPFTLLTYIVPDCIGSPYYGNCDWSAYFSSYIGVLPLILGITGFLYYRDSFKMNIFFITILTIVISMGKNTPLHYILYKILPFYNMLRETERFLVITSFCLIIIAGKGLDLLFHMKNNNEAVCKFIKIMNIVFLPIIIITGFALIYKDTRYFLNSLYSNMSLSIGIFFIFFVMSYITIYVILKADIPLWLKRFFILVVIVSDLFLTGMKLNPVVNYDKNPLVKPEELRLIESDKSLFRILSRTEHPIIGLNLGMVYGISDVSGFDSIILRRYMNYYLYSQLNHIPDDKNTIEVMTPEKNKVHITEKDFVIANSNNISLYYLSSPLLNLLNLKYSFTGKKTDDNNLVPDIIVNNKCLPRFFMVPDYAVKTDEKEILQTINSKEFNPFEYVILEENPEGIKNKKGKINYIIEHIEYSPDEIKFDLKTDREGFLFLSEIYYPGWNAWVDTDSVKIYRANYIFRAIYVTSGEHIIKFKFQPLSYKIGKIISIITLFICVIVFLFHLRKSKLDVEI